MRYLMILLVAYALSPALANASPGLSVENLVCQGTETTDISDVLSIDCSGDLALLGGSITADSKILITAIGTLTLDDLLLSAPEISLSGSSIFLEDGASITGNTLFIAVTDDSSGALSVSPGADISTNDGRMIEHIGAGGILPSPDSEPLVTDGAITIMPVPEPTAYASLLIGLLVLAASLGAMKRR